MQATFDTVKIGAVVLAILIAASMLLRAVKPELLYGYAPDAHTVTTTNAMTSGTADTLEYRISR